MAEIPVLHLTPKWSETIMADPRHEPLCVVRRDPNGLSATLSLPAAGRPYPITMGFAVQVGDPDADFDARGRCLAIRRWGLRRLGPGVWQVVPSLVQETYGLHAYVVLCDVPEPAPFVAVAEPCICGTVHEGEQPPHAVEAITLRLDGSSWCALAGPDLQEGVAGFGDTPAEACAEFDREWREASDA